MTEEEARKIAEIAVTVDGGCFVCVGGLLTDLQVSFPEFDWAELAPGNKDEWRKRIRRGIPV